jgi:predicted Zn-dependent protease
LRLMNAFARKTLIVVVVMVAVALAGWAGRKAYIRATMHRLLSETSQYLEKQDIKDASLCLRQALSLNSANVTANNLMADMLEEAGSPAALGWRIRTAQLETNNVEYRFAWAQTALKANDLSSAAQALGGVDEKFRSTAEFHKLRGALAWNLHVPPEAEKEYAEALRLEPTNQVVSLNLATIGLVSTNPSVVENARSVLEKIPPNSPLHLAAIRFLTDDAMAHKSFERALFFSQQVVNDPKTTYADKLTRLQILDTAKSPGFDAWMSTLQADAAHSPQHAYVLAHWMQEKQSPSVALKWLQGLPSETGTNVPVQLAVTDCQMAMKDWRGLLATVQRQDWDEFNYYRLSLVALANRNLDDSVAEKSAWRRSLIMSSSRLDRLTKLDQLTGVWGWSEERSDVLQEIIAAFPRETWAGEELVALYYADGKTRALADLLDKLYSADPSNMRFKNNLATVLMLLNSDTQKAHRLALESYASSTNNPFFACTYAYSLLLQSKPEEAAKVVGTLNTNTLKIPAIAAYYGVVEAEAGHPTAAKEALKLATSARLLPEEQELVRKAERRL